MRFRRWLVPCLTVDRVRTEETKSCLVSLPRIIALAYLVVGLAYLLNLALLLLDEAVQTVQIQLFAFTLLDGFD